MLYDYQRVRRACCLQIQSIFLKTDSVRNTETLVILYHSTSLMFEKTKVFISCVFYVADCDFYVAYIPVVFKIN